MAKTLILYFSVYQNLSLENRIRAQPPTSGGRAFRGSAIASLLHFVSQQLTLPLQSLAHFTSSGGRMKLCAEQTSHTKSQHPYLLKNLPQPCVFSFLAYGIKVCMGFLVAYGNMHTVAWKFGMVHREVA